MNRIVLVSIFHIRLKTVILSVVSAFFLMQVWASGDDTSPLQKRPLPGLRKAVLCEKVLNSNTPIDEGVVFSSKLGKLFCFTDFDPVYDETVIYHRFYFKDKLSSKFPFTLKPPRWAVQSTIYLRESDKGPWRVEITDAEGNIFSSIRFSITD